MANTISPPAMLALKGLSYAEKAKFADEIGVSTSTFTRWLRDNDEQLTMGNVLLAISRYTGLAVEVIFPSLTTNVQQ